MALAQRCDKCGHVSNKNDITAKVHISLSRWPDFSRYDREDTIDLCENCIRKLWPKLRKGSAEHVNERIDWYAEKKASDE